MSIETILVWVAIGAIAGWIAGFILHGKGFGTIGNIIVGIIGSFLGSWIGNKFGVGAAEVGTLSIASVITAIVGSLALLILIGIINKTT